MQPDDLQPRVAAELIRTQYLQLQRSSIAVVIFVVLIVSTHTPGYWVFGWAAVYLLFLGAQEAMLRRYRHAAPDDADIAVWGRVVGMWLTLSGLIWGAGFYHFVDPAQPLTIGLLIATMAALTAGAIGLRSSVLPGFYAFVALVCGSMALRFFVEGGSLFVLLGLSMLFYAPIILSYGRAQHHLLADSLAMRFRNEALVAALRDESHAAEHARREAEQANLAKSQFLAAASHDLRQPLYALSLFSGSLGELKLSAGARTIVRDIQDSIAAMEALFAGLLDISKLEAGVVEPRLEPVSLDALFDRLSQYFRPIALARGLDLRFRADGDWVTSDAVLLEQVLGNLVSNALRWTTQGGVLIAARRRRRTVRLEVWDTGIGISPANQQRIFDDFVQLDNVERDRRKGLGLGLAIARRSARLIGSAITLASREGIGSRFAIVQPVADAPASIERTAFEAPALPRDPTLPILVVEDDPDVRAALGDLLVRWHVAATIVSGPIEALAALAEGQRFGLVLCDYRLSAEVNGLDLLRDIADAHNELSPPMALITGDVASDIILAAHKRGILLLHKPVKARDLTRLLGLSEDVAVAGAVSINKRPKSFQ